MAGEWARSIADSIKRRLEQFTNGAAYMDNSNLQTVKTSAQQAALDDLGYYKNPRPEMLSFLPPNPPALVGCWMRRGLFRRGSKITISDVCETWGVEPEATPAKQALTRVDHVINASPFDRYYRLAEQLFRCRYNERRAGAYALAGASVGGCASRAASRREICSVVT